MSAVACGSLSQSCQRLSLVTLTKLTKVHFKTRELALASVADKISFITYGLRNYQTTQ